MEFTKDGLREEITRIVKSNTLCSEGEALGASGNIIGIPLISAAPDMHEALRKVRANIGHIIMTKGDAVLVDKIDKALAKAEGK